MKDKILKSSLFSSSSPSTNKNGSNVLFTQPVNHKQSSDTVQLPSSPPILINSSTPHHQFQPESDQIIVSNNDDGAVGGGHWKHLYSGRLTSQTRPYVGLSLPSWYQPKVQSTLLRRRFRSKQWVTYQDEVTPGKISRFVNKTCSLSSLSSMACKTTTMLPPNAQSNIIKQQQMKKSAIDNNSSKNNQSNATKYHIVKGYISPADDGVNGDDTVDEDDDPTEPHQKVKLIVLLLMIPSIAVMFYSQTRFRRESNVVGDLAGLGLPNGYLTNGIGSRDFTSRFNSIYDHQMRSDHEFDDPLENNLHQHSYQSNHNHQQQQHEKKNGNFDEQSKVNSDVQQSIKNNDKVQDERSVKSPIQNELSSENLTPRREIYDLKTVKEYKVILYEDNHDIYNVNHLPDQLSTFNHCISENRCLIATDVTLMDISDAQIITDYTKYLNQAQLKSSDKVPPITIFYQLSPFEWSSQINSYYNLTLSYSYDAHIIYRPVLMNKVSNDYNKSTKKDISDIDNNDNSGKNGRNAFNLWRNKRKLVLIVTTECTIDQSLTSLVARMESLGIDVDLVSLCQVCPTIMLLNGLNSSSLESCLKILSEPHLFLLTWETDLCPQYVSPITYLGLTFNLIPIILYPFIENETHTHLNLPQGSYINAANFSSLNELGDHLNLIASDLNQYQGYIKWTETYEISLRRDDLCSLCSYLHGNHTIINKLPTKSPQYQINTNSFKCIRWDDVQLFKRLL